MIKATMITTRFINGVPVRERRWKRFFRRSSAERWIARQAGN